MLAAAVIWHRVGGEDPLRPCYTQVPYHHKFVVFEREPGRMGAEEYGSITDFWPSIIWFCFS
jgi:hypothetical protein